jgi:hypothetical protein
MRVLHTKVLVSDPLYMGESGFTVPLRKGDSREAAGGRSHAMLKSIFCATSAEMYD